MRNYRKISGSFTFRKLVRGFTIIELLVSMGLFAAVIAAAGMVFHYSIESQRTAAATAEIMRTLRAVTDQLNIDFQGLRSDGYLILYSEQKNPPADTNNYDALYYFSTGDYQSWSPAGIRSNIARIFLGHSQLTYNNNTLPGDFARDVLLLATTHTRAGNDDCANIGFEQCQASLNSTALYNLLGEPTNPLTSGRPNARANNFRSLFSQNVGSFKIEWTYGWVHSTAQDRMVWWGIDTTPTLDANDLGRDGSLEEFGIPGVSVPPSGTTVIDIANAINETAGPPYMVEWNPTNQQYWPKALKFTFTLYDSKRILKGGRTFEHIVYLGN